MVINPLEPFLSLDERGAARLESDVGAGDYRRRKGFGRATKMLLEQAIGEEYWQDQDPLVWPALNCFRHYVELNLKHLAMDFPDLTPNARGGGHKIDTIWGNVKGGFTQVFGGDAEEPIGIVTRAVQLLTAIDPNGETSRYAYARDGRPTIAADIYLDPGKILDLVTDTIEVFEICQMAFHAFSSQRREIAAATE